MARLRGAENAAMVRPGRGLRGIRRVVRRRHRTWMLSMTLATVGWSVIWTSLVLTRWAPSWAPAPETSYGTAGAVAAVGLFFALFSIRAQLSWILICVAPLFANGSLLALRAVVPWLLEPHVEADEEGANLRATRPTVRADVAV